jgi:hypothetical protein
MASLVEVFETFKSNNSDEFVNDSLKICIGGGAGFIGSHLAQRLKNEVKIPIL